MSPPVSTCRESKNNNIEKLFPRLFTCFVNRVTEPIRANPLFEQSASDILTATDSNKAFDPFFFVTDIKKNNTTRAPAAAETRERAPAAAETKERAPAEKVIKRSPKPRCVRAPVAKDTFLYWVMIASDPEAELECSVATADASHDGRRFHPHIHSHTQRFKARLFDVIARRPDFLRETYVDPEERAITGKGSTAERRRREKVAEESLRALKAPDFDVVMNDTIIAYIAEETHVDVDFFDEEDWHTDGITLANEKEQDSRAQGRTYLRLLKKKSHPVSSSSSWTFLRVT